MLLGLSLRTLSYTNVSEAPGSYEGGRSTPSLLGEGERRAASDNPSSARPVEMTELLLVALGGALATVLASLFAACTRHGQRAWARVRSSPRRRRVRNKADAASPGQGIRAWITNPIGGDAFDGEIEVRGRVLDVPEDHEVWIVHRVPNGSEMWPKEKLAPDAVGWFEVVTLEGGRSRSMAVAVLLTPKSVSQEFEDWFQRGRQTGHFPGLRLPSSARVLASAVVRCEAVQ